MPVTKQIKSSKVNKVVKYLKSVLGGVVCAALSVVIFALFMAVSPLVFLYFGFAGDFNKGFRFIEDTINRM